MDFRSFSITPDDDGRRLDRVVRRFLPELSLSAVYKLIRKGLIRLDGKKCSPEAPVQTGSLLGIASVLMDSSSPLPTPAFRKVEPLITPPETILLTEDLLFINKPSGIPVHGIDGLDALIPQSDNSVRSLSFRTGPLHRLDRYTTGLLAFSRSLIGARWFSEGVRSHRFEKYYLGIVDGHLPEGCEWQDTDSEGRNMITVAHPLSYSFQSTNQPSTLVRFKIITGRKHQIRIQSAKHGIALSGDEQYNRRPSPGPYFLHAWQTFFPEDRLPGLPAKLTAALPERFNRRLLEQFGPDVLAHIEAGELYWN